MQRRVLSDDDVSHCDVETCTDPEIYTPSVSMEQNRPAAGVILQDSTGHLVLANLRAAVDACIHCGRASQTSLNSIGREVSNPAIFDESTSNATVESGTQLATRFQDTGTNTDPFPVRKRRSVDTSTDQPSYVSVECNTYLPETKSTNTTYPDLSTAGTNTAVRANMDCNTDPLPEMVSTDTNTATSEDTWTSTLVVELSSSETNTAAVDSCDAVTSTLPLPEMRCSDTNTADEDSASSTTPRELATSETSTAVSRSVETSTMPRPHFRCADTNTAISYAMSTSTLVIRHDNSGTNTAIGCDAETSTAARPVMPMRTADTNTTSSSESYTNTRLIELSTSETNTSTCSDAQTNTARRGANVDADTNTALLDDAEAATASWMLSNSVQTGAAELESCGVNTFPTTSNGFSAEHSEENWGEGYAPVARADDEMEASAAVPAQTITDYNGFSDEMWSSITGIIDRFLANDGSALTSDTCTQTEEESERAEIVDSATGDDRPMYYLIDCGSGDDIFDVKNCGVGDGTAWVEERGTGDGWAQTGDVWTSTLTVTLADKSTDMVQRHMVSKNEGTDNQDTVDVGTSPADDVTTTYRTVVAAFHRPTTVSRGTAMPPVPQTVDHEMLTEQPKMVDMGTSPNVDVTAMYRGRIGGPAQHRVTVSRGTITLRTKSVDRETTWEPQDGSDERLQNRVERGSSPVRFSSVDKAISVNRGALTEPVDVFVRSGGASESTSPGGLKKRLSGSCPRMDSICERSDESSSSSSSDGESGTITRKLAPPTRKILPLHRPVLPPRPSADTLRRFQQQLPPAVHRERFTPSFGSRTSTFSVEGSSQATPIVCRVEAGTNTSSVRFEDKAVGTDNSLSTVVVDEKMAECISKLRTVRQRLEQQQSPAGTPPLNASPPSSSPSQSQTAETSASSSPTPDVDLRRLIVEKCAERPLLQRSATSLSSSELLAMKQRSRASSVRHLDASNLFAVSEASSTRSLEFHRATRAVVSGKDDMNDLSPMATRKSAPTRRSRGHVDELPELRSSPDVGRTNRLARPTLFQQRSFSPRARQRRRLDEVSAAASRPGSAEKQPIVGDKVIPGIKQVSSRTADERRVTNTDAAVHGSESPQAGIRRRLPSTSADSRPQSRPSSASFGSGQSARHELSTTKAGVGAMNVKGWSPRQTRSAAGAAGAAVSERRPARAASSLALTEDDLRSTTSDSDSLMTQSGSSDEADPAQQQQQQQRLVSCQPPPQPLQLPSTAAIDRMRSSLARKQRLDITQLLTARPPSASTLSDREVAVSTLGPVNRSPSSARRSKRT